MDTLKKSYVINNNRPDTSPRKRWSVDIEEDTQIMGIRRWRKQCKERKE
jgi:hypothetical protein